MKIVLDIENKQNSSKVCTFLLYWNPILNSDVWENIFWSAETCHILRAHQTVQDTEWQESYGSTLLRVITRCEVLGYVKTDQFVKKIFPFHYPKVHYRNLMFFWPCIIVQTYFNNQLNAQILLFINNMYVTLQSSTCFEHQHAHLQEDKLYYHSIWYRHSL